MKRISCAQHGRDLAEDEDGTLRCPVEGCKVAVTARELATL